jgi:hypothetical protein
MLIDNHYSSDLKRFIIGFGAERSVRYLPAPLIQILCYRFPRSTVVLLLLLWL